MTSSGKARLSLALALTGLAACAAAQAGTDVAISPAITTEPTSQGGANMSVVVHDGAQQFIIGTAELGGLEIYNLTGGRVGSVAAGEAAGVDARAGVPVGSGRTTLVAAIDATTNSLRLFTFSGRALDEVGARAIPLGFAAENVCLYRNPTDSLFYAFVVGDGGEIDQQLIFATADGRLDARQSRRLHLPSTAEYCVADDATGQLYVSEEAVGLWRFNADPETDAAPTLIDAPRIGQVTGELAGVTLHDGGAGARWLIASDPDAARLLVYDRANGDAFVKAVPLGSAVEELAGLSASGALLGGALLIADDAGSNYKAFGLEALGIPAGTPQTAAPVAPPFPTVRARVETTPVPSAGDAADDPAIWANLKDPARSLVIGTDKRAGLRLYDIAGRELQFVPDGKMNNVDLREGYMLGGKDVILVTASDRTNKALAIYVLDPVAQRLTDVADGLQETGLSDPYGQCMYRSRTGRTYAFISDPDGLVRQWELVATSSGKVQAKPVRDVQFSSQTEGCVADDETGILYVAEEDIGLWRLSAEPDGGDARTSVDAVATNPQLTDDMEGIGLYDLGGGRGYLVLSSQGNNSYAVYRREGDNAYLGSFAVVADGTRGIDGISETDGLEVSSRNLGPGFEKGGMVAQDGRNVLPSEYQNFKYVSWEDIAKALNLEVRQ